MFDKGALTTTMATQADPQAALKQLHANLFDNIARHIGFDLRSLGFIAPARRYFSLGLKVSPDLSEPIHVRDTNAPAQVSLWISNCREDGNDFLISARNTRLMITSTNEDQFDARILNSFGHTLASGKNLNGQALLGAIMKFVADHGSMGLHESCAEKITRLMYSAAYSAPKKILN